MAAALSELGFDAAALPSSAPVAEEPKWWEGAGSRAGSVACLAVAALAVSPGLASAASSRSSGRVGGSNFGSRSTTAYSPAPAQQGFKGTSAAPTKAAETSTATAAGRTAAKSPTVKSTTVKNTTVNNTTVVKESAPVHHHHTTVIAAPAPCPVSTVVSAAATAAVVSSMHQPIYHQPMVAAPVMAAAPVVAAPVVYQRPFWTPLTVGLTCAGVFGLAAFLVSRNNNKRAEEW